MSSRRALLMGGRLNVTLTRTSDTAYLVEAVGGGTKANLKFKRLSDGHTQDVSNATLPYTFTHTEGEVWEVSRNRGATYVSAWGIDIPLGGALEAENFTDLDFNSYMCLRLKLAAGTIYSNNSPLYYGKIAWGTGTYWGVYSAGVSPYNGNITFYSVGGSGSGINAQRFTMQPQVNKWSEVSTSLVGSDMTLKVNDNSETLNLLTLRIPYQHTVSKFRIGNAYPSSSSVNAEFQGVVNYYKHGTEEFFMAEGSGSTTTGTEGTVLNLVGGASWVKI